VSSIPQARAPAVASDRPTAASFTGIRHWYPSAPDALVLDDVSLEIAEGGISAIVGPSGCGKTTLLNIAAGVVAPAAGTAGVLGRAPRPGAADVAYMLARDCLLPWRSALDNAALALQVQGVGRRERRRRAAEMLEELGLAGYESYLPPQLSQGMRQRVALARAFATRPRLLLLDEPFASLDVETRLDVHTAFLRLFESSSASALVVTHDVAEAVALADRVFVFTRRPGRLRAVVDVDLPRTHGVAALQSSVRFHDLCRAVWNELLFEIVGKQGERAE